jgi:hypothetical protein
MLEQGQNVDTGLVFVTRNGKPQSKRNALRAWTAALDKIGVDANLHSLRHSFISAHAERDTPVVLVSDLSAFACHHDPDALHPCPWRRTATARIAAKGALTTPVRSNAEQHPACYRLTCCYADVSEIA